MLAQSAYLLDRLQMVSESTSSHIAEWDDEDLLDVALEVSEYLRNALDVPRLEQHLVAKSQVDSR